MKDNTDAPPPRLPDPHELPPSWNTDHEIAYRWGWRNGAIAQHRAALAAQQGAQVLRTYDDWAISKGIVPETVAYKAMRIAYEAGLSASPQAPAQPELRMMQCPECGMEFADGALHDANLELHRLKKAAHAEPERHCETCARFRAAVLEEAALIADAHLFHDESSEDQEVRKISAAIRAAKERT